MNGELTDEEYTVLSMFFNEAGDQMNPEETLSMVIGYSKKHPNEVASLFKKGVFYTFKRAYVFGLGLPKLTLEGETELYQLFNDGHLPNNNIMPTHVPYDMEGVFLRSLKFSRVTLWVLQWN